MLDVIDTQTGAEPDLNKLAKEIRDTERHWANLLCHTNLACWAVDEEGNLLLTDTCGNYVIAPPSRYTYTLGV